MSSYQPGIPTGLVNLDVDYQNIKNNFQQLDTSFGVDHLPYSNATPQNGYHTSIHLTPMATPGVQAGYGQLFSSTVSDVNSDTALFWLTGGNRLVKLTENIVPVAASNGYTFIPGGFIVQWGFVNGTHGGDNHFNGGDFSAVPQSFNQTFPQNCFTVWAQPMYTSGAKPSGAATVAIASNFNTSGFNWVFTTNSSSYTRFFWYAIGN